VVVSYLNIEETLFMVPSQPKRAESRIRLIFELGDKRLVLRSANDALDNDFRSYADGEPIRRPFEPLTVQMETELWALAAPFVTSDKRELGRVLDKTRRIKEEHQDFMVKAKKKVELLVPSVVGGRYLFDDYWRNNSVWLVEGLAKRRRVLGKVRRQGLSRLEF
jgi:hypothetical protein